MECIKSKDSDANDLANLRAQAMKPSLVALGRFDEDRVRNRFLDTFVPQDTIKLTLEGELIGFYVLRIRTDHIWLDHLYIKPEHQNKQLGKKVLTRVIDLAKEKGLALRLGALKGSLSNRFYQNNGFVQTHEDEFDLYYEYVG
ncbi:MAG: GNAT family N-acetyltransferase [Marinomonas sp.]